MVNIDRVRVALTGFPGAPGVATFYALDGSALLNDLQTLWAGIIASMPSDVTTQIENVGDTLSASTGELVDSWSGTSQDPQDGAAGGAYASPVGFMFQWFTADIMNGHRLRGRTYVVPAAGSCFETDGSVTSATAAAQQGFGEDFQVAQADNFVVWHRPKYDPGHVLVRNGSYGLVSSAVVPRTAVVLRSRRD